MDKISAVYKVTNNVTGDFYIGSSVDVKKRWKDHKVPSTRKNRPNMLLYKAIQEYGLDKFNFEILEEVEPERLRQAEQKFIDMLKPTYNSRNAKGWDVEGRKDKAKEFCKKYNNQLCEYNGETLTLAALRNRFRRTGIKHPNIEAKKYLV